MCRVDRNRLIHWPAIAGLVILGIAMATCAEPVPDPIDVPDKWDFYLCKVDQRPASIILNFWFEDRLPIAEAPVLYWCAITIKEPGDHGMGVGDDAEQLRAIEDALNLAAGRHGLYPVGRLRNSGIWQITYYGPAGVDIQSLSAAQLEREGREFRIGASDDPEWKYFKDFLLPDEERRQWMADSKVVAALQRSGDPLTQTRRVDHWIYCTSQESRDALRTELEEQRFTVQSEWEDHEHSNERPYALQVYRDDSVELEKIHAVIMELVKQAQAVGADYDGWETPVLKPESGPAAPPVTESADSE